MYRPSNVQCDYPDRVDCGDRPVCDDNDENCEDHHLTTTTPKPSPCDDIECDHGDDFYPEGNQINAINKNLIRLLLMYIIFYRNMQTMFLPMSWWSSRWNLLPTRISFQSRYQYLWLALQHKWLLKICCLHYICYLWILYILVICSFIMFYVKKNQE